MAERLSFLLQHPSALTMALGKKSFLIRDILENNQASNRYDPGILHWILHNQNHQSDLVNKQEVDQAVYPSPTSSIESLMLLARNCEGSSGKAMMLAKNRHLQEQNGGPANQLYQNLYYYALQQHLSQAMHNQTHPVDMKDNGTSQIGNNHNSQSIKFKSSLLNRFDACADGKANVNLDKTNDLKPGRFHVEDNDDEMQCQCMDLDDNDHDSQGKCAARSKCKKLRRNRTVFTELQLMGLEKRFDSQKYLSTPDRADLARALGLTQLQVKTWYQNRRMKWKKQVMLNGCVCPTKPKGRPKKDSIPTYGIEYTNSLLCPIFSSAAAGTMAREATMASRLSPRSFSSCMET